MPVQNVPEAAAPQPLFVTQLASRRASWSSTRQAAIAGNIANADTPHYKARDIAPFDAAYEQTHLRLSATQAGHMRLSALEAQAMDVDESRSWDMTHSANTVSLDEELMKADETARSHQLSLSVMGAFHRMLMTSVSFP